MSVSQKRCVLLVAWGIIGGASVLPALAEEPADPLKAYEAAVQDPFDEAKLQAYLDTLPQDEGLFIIEADLPMTEDEVKAYLVNQSSGTTPAAGRGGELIVNLHLGQQDFYRNPSDRTLTYVISKASFPSETNYRSVMDLMASATEDWEDACTECQIDFQHLDKLDAGADPGNANFVVRHRDTGGAFIARAFFPHDQGDRREIVIDPSFFQTDFDKTGVLRHELGHVLGYRHEHTRGVMGCRFEDGNWVPLTEYDPDSVMHYFCGGAGSFALEITEVDQAGHRILYGGP